MFAAEQPDGIDPARTTVVPLRRYFHFVPWLTAFAFSKPLVRAAQARRPTSSISTTRWARTPASSWRAS